MADRPVRYAVVGLGSIAREAVLPGFVNAARNSVVSAFVTGEPERSRDIARQYRVDNIFRYDQFEECLREVDAVYIALPNHLHREYTERAARNGVHVLCEKPMAPTAADCQAMIDAARNGGVKLMIAYRLHFEAGNLEAVRLANSGELGESRYFTSAFSQQTGGDNVRLTEPPERGGGPLFDLGVYCINAARYLFRDEPLEVAAFRESNGEERFRNSAEMVSVLLRFPRARTAAFTVSFNGEKWSSYTVGCARGAVRAEPVYDYTEPVRLDISAGGKRNVKAFPVRDQFGPELLHFSDCILQNQEPGPSGEEGMADVQVVEAAYRSMREGRSVPIDAVHPRSRPQPSDRMDCPVVEPRTLKAG